MSDKEGEGGEREREREGVERERERREREKRRWGELKRLMDRNGVSRKLSSLIN